MITQSPRLAGLALFALCAFSAGTGAWAIDGSGRPEFTRLTEGEVAASKTIRDFDTPFLGWGPNDNVGFLGAGGLYDIGGELKVARTCGAHLRDSASPATGELYALLGDDGRVCVFQGTSALPVAEVRANAVALAMANAHVLDAGGVGSTAPYLASVHGSTATARDAGGKKRWARDPDLGPLSSAASSVDRGFFAFGGERGAAVLHGGSGRLVRAVTTGGRAGPDPVYTVGLDIEGNRLLTGQSGGRVTVWSTETGQPIQTIDFGDGDVIDVSFSRDGAQVTAVSRSGSLLEFEVWDLFEDAPVFREYAPAPSTPGLRPKLRIAPWGRSMMGSDGAGYTRSWHRPSRMNMPSGQSLREIPHHRPTRVATTAVIFASVGDATGDTLTPSGLIAAPAGRTRLAVDASGASVWVDTATGKDLAVIAPDGKVRARHALQRPAVAASLLGERLLVVADDGSMRATSRAGTALAAQKEVARASAVAAAADSVTVWGSAAGDVTFAGGGEEPRLYIVHAGPVVALATSEDGQTAISVGPRWVDVGAALAAADPSQVPTLGVSLLLRDPARRGSVSSAILGGSQAYSWVVDGTTASVSLHGDQLALVRTDLETVVFDIQSGGRRMTLPYATRDATFAAPPRAAAGKAAQIAPVVRWIDPYGHERRSALTETAQVERPRGRTLCESQDQTAVATLDADVLTLWKGHDARQGRSFAATGTQLLGCTFNEAGTRVAFLDSDGRFEAWAVDSERALAGVNGAATRTTLAGEAPVDPWFAFAPVIIESDRPAARPLSGTRADLAMTVVTAGQLPAVAAAPGSVWVRMDATHLAQLDLREGKRVETIEIPPGVGHIDSRAGRFATLHPVASADVPAPPVGYLDLAPGPSSGVGRRVWPASEQPLAAHGANYVWAERGSLRIGPAGGPALESPLPGARPLCGALTPDGKLLAIADIENRIALMSLPWRTAVMVAAGTPPTVPNPSPATERLWFDGENLLGRDARGAQRHWPWMAASSGATGQTTAIAPGPVTAVNRVHALARSPDGRILYSAQEDNLVRAWDIERATQRTAFLGPVGPVHALDVSDDGRLIAVGSTDGTVRVFDTVTKVDEHAFLTSGESTEAVAFQQEGKSARVASLSDRGTLRAWDMASGKALVRWTVTPFQSGQLSNHLDWLPGLARLTVTLGGFDWRVSLSEDGAAGGEPTTQEQIPEFLGHPSAWVRLKAGLLASADALGHILLWEEATQLPYARLTMLSDGGWISDRIDGVQIASQTLRDGSSMLLYGHGGQMEAYSDEKLAAFINDSLIEDLPIAQECLALAPATAGGALVKLGWTISAGVARNLEIVANTTGSDGVVGCLVDAVLGMRYDLTTEVQRVDSAWIVAGSGDVRGLVLKAEDASAMAAVESALQAALAKAPNSCQQKGVTGQARVQWRVTSGAVQGLTVLEGTTVPAQVTDCLATAVKSTRVTGVDRATGVWVKGF